MTNATNSTQVDDPDFVKPAIIQSYIDKFQKASDGKFERHTAHSLDWFRKRISKDLNKNRHSMITQAGDYKKRTGKENKTLVGRLLYFEYLAEEAGDKELQVYDQFPMVFIFNTSLSNDGKKLLHALNMHYLLPKERAIVYLKLLKLRNKKSWSYATKLKLSWVFIKSLLSHRIYEKAVHTYRVDRMQSKLIEIYPEDWEIAVFLRLEKWVSVDAKSVKQADIRTAHRKRTAR